MTYWFAVILLGFFSLSWLYGTYTQTQFATNGNRDVAWSLLLLFLWVTFNRETFNPLHTLWIAPTVMVASIFTMVSSIYRSTYPLGRFLQLGVIALVLVWLTQQ